MKKALLLIITVFIPSFFITAHTEESISVVMLNPGESAGERTGAFWQMMGTYMEAAADDLNIGLEMIYSERDYFRMVELAHELSLRDEQPDYIILVNEKGNDIKLMTALEDTTSKIIFMHNDPDSKGRMYLGNERGRYQNWIGSFLTDSRRGGYLVMKELCENIIPPIRIGAISGDRITPVSTMRINGMLDYAQTRDDIDIKQIIYADWSYRAGEKIGYGLLGRYPKLNAIWSANDAMAMGVLEGIKKRNITIPIVGQGGFPDALQAVESGDLVATLGGHTMLGAYVLVMLYDYHMGIDFATATPRIVLDNLFIINQGNSRLFRQIVLTAPQNIDFAKLSLHRNKNLTRYDFSFEKIQEIYSKD